MKRPAPNRALRSWFLLLTLLSTACLAEKKSFERGVLVNLVSRQSSSGVYVSGSLALPIDTTVVQFVVKFGDLTITGQRELGPFDKSYLEEFVVGDPIDIRIDNDKLYIKRPNSKEIKTKIVRRERS